MAIDDLDQILTDRLNAEAGATPAFDVTGNDDGYPEGRLDIAGSEKVWDLEGIAARKRENIQNALVNKAGLDPESYAGKLVNQGASLVSGLGRTVGQLINLPINAAANMGQAGVTDEAIEAYSRLQLGNPQEGDEAILNQVAAGDDTGVPQTMLQRMQGVDGLREAAKSVAETLDFSKLVDTTQRDELSQDIADETQQGVALLREAKDDYSRGNYLDALLSGLGGTVQTIASAAPAAALNPDAVVEYAVENAPQLAAAAYSGPLGVATNLGYGAEQYREGITDFQEANAGALPSAEQRTEMGLAAASAALAEQVGDLGVLRGIRSAGRSAAEVREGLTKAVLGSSVKEGVTEGYQTWAENVAHLQDTTIEQVVEGATIGAAVGGTLTAGGRAINTVRSLASRAKQDTANVQAAEETGDISDLVNTESENYNPAGAVSVLHKTVLDDAATPEAKQEAVRQADRIEQDLTQQVSQLEQRAEVFSEEGQQLIAQRIEEFEQALPEATPEEQTQINQRLEGLRVAQAAAEERTPEQAKYEESLLKDYRQRLTATRDAITRMQVDASPNQEQVSAMVQEAQAPDAQPETTQSLLTLTMTNPEAINLADVESLVSNEQNSFTPEQRTALQEFSTSQAAVNEIKNLGGVSTDIQTGGDGFKGLNQYRNSTRMALMDGNIDAAQGQVDQLRQFAVSRASKRDALQAAFAQVQGTDNSIKLVRDQQGNWVQAPDSMTPRQVKSAGGVTVFAKSGKLVQAVALEAAALESAANSLQAMVQAGPIQAQTAPVQAAEQPLEEGVTPAVTTGDSVQVSPEAAEEATASTEVTNPVEEASVQEEATPETGELTAVRNAAETRGQPVSAEQYQRTNLVGAFFEQVPGKEDAATQRPLVTTPNLASQYRAGNVNIEEFTGAPLTGTQAFAVSNFFAFQAEAQPFIEANLKQYQKEGQDNAAYYFKDYAQFLINQDGSLDENLTTGIAYAAYSWINDNASQLVNSDESINAILGRDSETEVSPQEREALSYIGTRQGMAISQLGAKVTGILGLEALANAPVNERTRLETSLGGHALALLVSMNLAVRNEISDARLQALMASGQKATDAKHFFFAPVTERVEGKLQMSEKGRQIREATVGTQSVLDKLFGTEQGVSEPSYEPIPFTQKMAKRTQQEVPSKLAEILNKQGAQAHYLREDMWQVWGNLSPAALYQIAGVVEVTDVPTHAANRIGREAKNDGLKAQVDNFSAYFNKIGQESPEGQQQALYFGRSVWKPQRVGLTSNVINPQTSKVHRHMLRMEEWKTSINLNDQEAMDGFKLRVLEAFGVKTEAKDTATVLAGYDAKINTPEVQEGVVALAEILRGEANDTSANEAAILAAVNAGGENFHSFDALVALAHEYNARQQGLDSFESEMMGEVDGVTNGPMLSLLMLGAKDFTTLNQGGFFQMSSPFTQFNDYHAQAGNHDLYESTIAGVLRNVSNNPLLASIEVITGQLRDKQDNVTSKGRKVIKQPLTAMMFGSNTKTAVDGMAESFISTIYEKMEDAAKANDQQMMENILTAVNQLIAAENKVGRLQLDTKMGITEALNKVLNDQQVKAVKGSFYKLLGKPTEDSLNDTYGLFMARRDAVNKAADLAYSLYEAVYSTKRELATENSNMPKNRAGQSVVDVTTAQDDQIRTELQDMMPILHTALSKESKQLSSGMLMAKSRRQLNDSTPYVSEIHFGQSVNYNTFDEEGKLITKNTMTITSNGLTTRIEGPGVAPLITSIHSTDSYIASYSYDLVPSLNIHDALGTSLDRIHLVGQTLNNATFNAMLNYSTASEMVGTLERVIAGFTQQMQDPVMAERLQPKLKEILEGREKNVAEQLESIRHVAREADTDKLSMLADMKAIGQYATDGGSHLVTEEQRTAAQEALNKIGSEFNEVALTQADTIDSFVEASPEQLKANAQVALSNQSVQTLAPSTTLNVLDFIKRDATEQQKQDIETVQREMADKNIPLVSAKEILPEERREELVNAVNAASVGRQSVWGKLGTPINVSDPALVDLLNTEGLTARTLAQGLEERTENAFTKKLLQALVRLTRDIPVVMITSDTSAEDAYGEGVTNARGWYAQQGNREALFVKNTEFVESGINEEFLTHELLHTVTGRVIQNELDARARNSNYTSRALKLVEELEALQGQAKEMISQNGALSAKYANAVSNVHELVSWGMTNQGFQEEVLKNIQTEAPRSVFATGLQRFINTLTNLIFRNGTTAAERTGMGLLIANTSGLFAEAKTQMDQGGLTLRYEDEVQSAQDMSTQEIFLALGSNKANSAAYQARLMNLLDGIVTNLHGPMGAFFNSVARGQAMTTQDAFIKALDTGRLPFASKALASAFVTNAQEQFVLEQVEATVDTALSGGEGLFIRDSLDRLFTEAKAKLSAKDFFKGDWTQATQAEKDTAQEKYDFLFRVDPQIGTRNEYLSRFAALGLASEDVSTTLGFRTASTEQSTEGLSIFGKLMNMFRNLMSRLGRLHDKTQPGELANHRLYTLVDRLVDIEAKRRGRISDRKTGLVDQLESALAGAGDKARSSLEAFGQSAIFKSSSSTYVRLTGNVISTLAADRVDVVLDGIQRLRDEKFKGQQQGVLAGVLTEMRGRTSSNEAAHFLFNEAKQNEVARKQHIEYTVEQVNAAFADNGVNLTADDKSALTNTMLRTNMSALYNHLGFEGVKQLVENQHEALRTQLEDQVLALPNGKYYLRAVKDLAYNRVIGGNVSPNLMMNVQNIVEMLGTFKALSPMNATRTAATPLLEQLQAIYSYDYAGSRDKQLMTQIFRTEAARGKDNGVEMILKLHSGMQKQSMDFLFEGTERLAISGYVPDIFDNKIEVLFVQKTDRSYFEKRGYVFGGNVQVDERAGLEGGKILMTRRGSGQVGILSGALSLTGLHVKGTKIEKKAIDVVNDPEAVASGTVSTVQKNLRQEVREMFDTDRSYDPRKQRGQRVAPVVDPRGIVVNYRYMMTEAHRDSLLDRDNSMDQVLGTMAGQIIDKVSSEAQNTNVVRAMYDQYKEDFANRPSSYLEIGPNSQDPNLLEMYQLLPERTKREILNTWKSQTMMVPADQINLIMGYRKLSMTTPFGISEEDRNIFQHLFVKYASMLLGPKAELRIGKAEDVIQEVVKEIKDILVVKNLFTLVGNVISNMTLLAWEGVPISEAARNTAIAMKGAIDYRKDNKRVIQLQRALSIGYIPEGETKAQEELAMLQDRMARNPVKPLIDAGLMPTIVEDVEADASQYSYKSLLQRKTEGLTNRIPKVLRDIGRQVYMTHDTSTYKFLSQTTQLSDLVARYALYQHVTTRSRDPLSKADALQLVEEAFVNYDLPSHKTIQFMNDMGLFMFTKYYLRIQKVIARLVKEKPARALGMVVANHFISGLDSILDSSWINKIGHNPFQAGPFGFPSSLGELPAIKGLMNL